MSHATRKFPLLAVAAALVGAGCARYPDNESATPRKQLLVTLTVRGEIQRLDALTPYYYFVLINLVDTIGEAGPVPVVDRIGGTGDWGNGFAAASQSNPDPNAAQGFIGFVQYDRFQGQNGYQVYRVQGNPIQRNFVRLGTPDAAQTPQPGERTLSFRLDLSRLKLSPNDPDKRFLQINLLATNNLPAGVNDAPKLWDALGDGTQTGSINSFLTLDITQNITRRNVDLPFGDPSREPENDVRDHLDRGNVSEPNLDIVDWTIEVRSQ